MGFSEWLREQKKKEKQLTNSTDSVSTSSNYTHKNKTFSSWLREQKNLGAEEETSALGWRNDEIAPVNNNEAAPVKSDDIAPVKETDWNSVYEEALRLQTDASNSRVGLNSKKGKAYKTQKAKADSATEAFNAYLKQYGVANIDELKQKTQTGNEKTWFKSSNYFDDGWDFGDVTKTIIGTVGDINAHLMEGFSGVGEKIVDAAVMLGARIEKNHLNRMEQATEISKETLESFGYDSSILPTMNYQGVKNQLEEETSEFVKKDLYDEEEIANFLVRDPLKVSTGISTEDHSVMGEKSDELAVSAGQLGAQMAVSTIPGVGQAGGMLMMGATTFGSEAESALQQGATFDEAVFSATVSAGAEMLTEKLGGISFGGKTVTDAIFSKMSSKLTSKLSKALLVAGKIGADATTEGIEEILSGYMSAAGQKLSYMEDKEIEEIFSSEDALDSFIGGVVLGGLSGSGEAVIKGEGYVTGLNKSEQRVFDRLYDDAIAEKEKGGKKLTSKEKSEIYNNILDNMEKGNISTDTIEETLGGDDYKAYKEIADLTDGMTKEFDELGKKDKYTLADQYRYSSLMEKIKSVNEQKKTARAKLDDTMSQFTKNNRLAESYNEQARKHQAFKVDLNQYEGAKRTAYERAMKSGVLNNTNKSHALVDTLATIEADKGIIFDYTDNKKLQELGFALEGKTVNGFASKSKGSVTLNVQSAKAWQSTVGHEIGHILKGTEAYTELQNTLFKYAESKGELATRRAELTELYKNIKDTDIEEELTCDLIGDYIFTDKNFINHLIGNETLFKKCWNEVKYFCKVATGKELTEIEKVEQEFRKVWKEYSANGKKAVDDGKVNLSVSATTDVNIKQKQFEIVQENNPMYDDYHTGIRSTDDIRTWDEVLALDDESEGQFVWGDFSRADAEQALKNGTITVYSSYPIENGVFVSTSRVQAQEYAGGKNGQVYSKTIPLTDVAWINGDEGQYAKVTDDTKSVDSKGNELSIAVKKRFKNSKAVDENGNLKVLYHGTASGEFYIFDKSKGNVEGDFGSGFYFTDSESDVKRNYEGGGPDFETKIDRRAEQIESEEGIDYIKARKKAINELFKGGNKHTVYVNIENPAIVGETYLFDYDSFAEEYDRNDYDSDEDYEGDVENLIADKIDEIIWEIERNIDIYSTDGIADVLWNAVNGGGIGIEELKAKINDLYLEDNNGNLVGNEVTRQIIESLGYDGIIDNTVSSKFKGMNLNEGTTHYIVFKPNQIKSIENQNPTDNPDIRFSLSNGERIENTLTGKEISEQSYVALNKLQSGESVALEELEALPEVIEGVEKVKEYTAEFLKNYPEFENVPKKKLGTHLITTEEREQLRNEILQDRLKSGSFTYLDKDGNEVYNGSVEKGKRLDIVIGLPAAGKSTSIVLPLSQYHKSVVVDSDIIKQELPEFNGGWGASLVHEESSELNTRLFKEETILGNNIVLPIVGSKVSSIEDYITLAKIRGYDVHLHLNELNSSKAMGRMLRRYFKDGRFIPPSVSYKYGDKPTEIYEEMKNRSDLSGYSHWNNDVAKGQRPTHTDSSGSNRALVEYSRTWRASRETDIEGSNSTSQSGESTTENQIAPIKETSSKDGVFSLSKQGEEMAPVGDYSTPLNETALVPTQETISNTETVDAPIRTVAENTTPVEDNAMDDDTAKNETVEDAPMVETPKQNNVKKSKTAIIDALAKYIQDFYISYDSNFLNGDHNSYDGHLDKEASIFDNAIKDYRIRAGINKAIYPDVYNNDFKNFIADSVENWETNYDSNNYIHQLIDRLQYSVVTEDVAPMPTDADAPPVTETEYYNTPDTTALDEKTLNNIGKSLRETLSLTAEETKAIQDIVQEYSTSEMPNIDDLFKIIKDKFAERFFTDKDTDLAEIKRFLKSSSLYVSDSAKAEISDWKSFRGKVKLAKNGLSVDRYYDNLVSTYPNKFNYGMDKVYGDLTNPLNQIKKIEAVANERVFKSDSRLLDDDTIREAVNIISNEVVNYKNNLNRTAAEDTAQEALDAIAPSKAEQLTNGTRGDALLNQSLDNYPIKTVEDRIKENIRAVEGDIADNQALRRESIANIDKEIERLSNEYLSKKDKNTQVANKLISRIAKLQDKKARIDAQYAKRISDLEARREKMDTEQYNRAMHKQDKMQEHAKWAEDLLGDTSTWKDKKLGIQYEVNTEHRNLRDIVRDENGNKDIEKADAIYDATMGEYNRNQAERNRRDAEISKKYEDLKVNKYESVYANMLGELRHNPETTLTEKDVKEYYEKHKKKIDTEKVDKFIDYVRSDLDTFFEELNTKLREQGMKEIPYRKGYFPHKVEPKQNFIQKLLNWKTQDNEIPTSIAGLTEDFKPVKSWQSFDKQRHGDTTDYDLLRLFQNYKQGALDWIYHLEDIQKRRAIENHIRYTHSDEGIQAKIKEVYADENLDADEAQAQIEHILAEAKNPLNNFIQDFTTHTNILTGKKNSLDRTTEQKTNRKIYTVMMNVQNRTSANMVLANVRSALTNFIPITQSWAQVSPLRSLQATKDTIANTIKDDGLINKSTFLTNRLREADSLHKTTWDKILDKAGIMFEVIDNFSSQVVWRSKYNDNLAKGMSESDAIANADQFAENVLAGRSKGNMPTIFDAKNPLTKAFTMFQLEVNNQYGYFFKDVPTDLKAETNHWKLNLAKGFTTAFIGSYVYNALMEQVAGSGAALDPIGIIEDLLKDLDDDDEEKTTADVIMNFIENVGGELPFVGGTLFDGGRIPISSALPYGDDGLVNGIGTLVEDVSEGNWGNIGKEMMAPILNIGLPVGGNQIKKTYQGLSMFDDDLPVTGSYTDSGALRFPVADTFGNRVQAAIFGQYASDNAREYFDNDYAPLKEKQIQEYVDVELPIADYWKYREGLKGLDKNAEKADYINSLDIADWQKTLLMNNILDRKEDVDMSNYDDYNSFEEFDFAEKNPEKYAFFKDNGISYTDYNNADEDGKAAYTWAYNNPEKYKVSKAVTDDVIEYRSYTSDLSDIKADKDENGNSISGSAKDKKIDYINSLDLDYGQKIILFKMQYKTDDTYNADIVDYVNNLDDLTYEDRVSIYTELGFTIKDGYVYWD